MRLFLALELAAELREGLARLQSELAGRCRGWRWARPEGIHLTLRFLGEVDPATDAAGRAGWRAVTDGCAPFRYSLSACGAFPERGRPRVLWVGVEEATAGALGRLASGLEAAARELGLPPESRPFRPHLTLARARRGAVATLPRPPIAAPALGGVAREVVLFRSTLGAGGARYTALDRFPLAAGDGR